MPAEVAILSAIDTYIARYGPDVSMVDLRGYVRSELRDNIHPSHLAKRLRQRGYVREGYRRIDSCPGKSLFYVLPTGAT